MGLLDSTIRSLVGNAANFLMEDMTLTRKSDRTQVLGTGVTETETNYSVRGFVEEPTKQHIALGLAEVGDCRVILLQTQSESTLTEISPGDEITASGVTSVVNSVDQDSAQATWELFCSPCEPDTSSQNVSV